jgi:AraC-like DNA-binding protein
MNKIAFYLSRMTARRYPPEQVLKNTGLSESSVVEGSFNRSPGLYRQIIQNMISLTDDAHIGMKLGFEFNISDLGVLGYAALSSRTLEQSRNLITKYALLNEHVLKPHNYMTEDQWLLELHEPYPLGDSLSFAVEEFVARMISFSITLTNREFQILELRVTYPEPKNKDIYRKYFKCPVYFDQQKNLITLDIERLNDPIKLANDDVFDLCERQCRELVSELDENDTLVNKIKRICLKMPGKFPTMQELAIVLNISARTLRRRLIEENVTYQAILNEVKNDLAMQYLSNTKLSPKEIGYLVGYSNVSNFRRAFKVWTGKKLSDFRP